MPSLVFGKVGRVFSMVFVYLLPHMKFGPNDHREDAPHFTQQIMVDSNHIISWKVASQWAWTM